MVAGERPRRSAICATDRPSPSRKCRASATARRRSATRSVRASDAMPVTAPDATSADWGFRRAHQTDRRPVRVDAYPSFADSRVSARVGRRQRKGGPAACRWALTTALKTARGRSERAVRQARPGCEPGSSRARTAHQAVMALWRHPIRGDRHVCHDRDVGRRSDSSLPRGHSRRGVGGPAPPHRRDAFAEQGARPGSLAGGAASDDPGAHPLLGDRVRLAQVRDEAERAAAV